MTVCGLNRSIVLTPPGAGAIGVVRVVGPDAPAIVAKLFQTRTGAPFPEAADDRLRYGWLADGGDRLDDVIVSCVPGSHSPDIDICVHGGIRVIERLLVSLERHGAPLLDAEGDPASIWPAANRIEKEAFRALGRAKTERAVRFLAWQRTHLAAALERTAGVCQSCPRQARIELEAMIGRYPAGLTLIDGATVAIVGPANSGKSTLLNRLAGRATTLVSPWAGTTRDWVAKPVEIEGVPVTLVDTAGHTAGSDRLGHTAVRAGWDQAREADLCLVVLDGSVSLMDESRELLGRCRYLRRHLIAMNKLDLGLVWDDAVLRSVHKDHASPAIRVSAQTGDGIDGLTKRVLASLGYEDWVDTAPCLFSERQVAVAREALADIGHHPALGERAIKWRLLGG